MTIIFSMYVFSWGCTEHALIYAISRSELNSTMIQKIDSILGAMTEFDAVYNQPLEMACWCDDISNNGLKAMDGFHFYLNASYQGYSPSDPYIIDPNLNIINAIKESIHTIKSKIKNSTFDGLLEKSLALRMLIHFMGDYHQPLHMATVFNKKHPNNDNGGMDFIIDSDYENLHNLWDYCMGMFADYQKPFTDRTTSLITNIAHSIMDEYTRSDLSYDLWLKDWMIIGRNTYEVALNSAYQGIQENEAPSADYLKNNFEICKRQIALAGYRLTDNLNLVLS